MKVNWTSSDKKNKQATNQKIHKYKIIASRPTFKEILKDVG